MILKHYWKPLPEVEQHVAAVCRRQNLLPSNSLILDIGGSPAHQFEMANHSVGWGGEDPVDLDHDHIGEWRPDFIYCRHTLEDLANPAHLLGEIAAMGCSGYIETPSPLAELTRGVDAWVAPHKGYTHHRWIVWSHEGVLYLLPKYPVVELIPEFDATAELNQGPRCWNNHHLWQGPLQFKVLRNERDFHLSSVKLAWFGGTPIEYVSKLFDAQEQYRASNAAFWNSLSLPQVTAA